jgi:hypothetical protein
MDIDFPCRIEKQMLIAGEGYARKVLKGLIIEIGYLPWRQKAKSIFQIQLNSNSLFEN